MPETDHNEKIWYRHFREGQRGYMVEHDGRKYIRFDRPGEVIEQIYRESEWMLDRETRPLNKHQVGRIAFEADKAACLALGEHEDARRSWDNLSEAKRLAWIAEGPPPGPRRELHALIKRWARKYTVD